MDCQIGYRRISHHLMKRCRHSINDILRHDNDKYKDAVDEYISYLEKEDSMEKYYPGKVISITSKSTRIPVDPSFHKNTVYVKFIYFALQITWNKL